MKPFHKITCGLLGAVIALLIIISYCIISVQIYSHERTDKQGQFIDWYMESFEIQ